MAQDNQAKHKINRSTAITTALLILIVIVLPFLFKDLLVSDKSKAAHNLSLPTQTHHTPELIKEKEDDWVSVEAQKGDSLTKVFKRAGVRNSTLLRLMKETGHKEELTQIAPGDEIKFKVDKDKRLLQLVLYVSLKEKLTISQDEQSHFHEKVETLAVQNHAHYVTAEVEHSLYYTAKKHDIPQALLKQLVDIFSKKIDFSREVRDKDTFTIIYNRIYINDKEAALGNIIAASFTNKHKTYYAIAYPDIQGKTSYYTPEGKSLLLGFDRYPIHFTHIGSNFNLHRYHPILHVTRAHKGIDLAASLGTPIKAVADGYISRIGLNGGYGKMIKVRHSLKYETVYGHMLRFKKGLSRGSKVLRGDVIGYVGQTGLATAPHCHYEFHIYARSVNPATVTLPSAPGVKKSRLTQFKAQANTLLQQLKLYEEARQNG